MERANSLSEQDTKQDNSSLSAARSPSREVHRTSSLGIDFISSYRRWFGPSNSGNYSASSATHHFSGVADIHEVGTPQTSIFPCYPIGQIAEITDENRDSKMVIKSELNADAIANLINEYKSRPSNSLEGKLHFLENLTRLVRSQQVNEQNRSLIFRETADLLDKKQPNEIRYKVWHLYTLIVLQGRAENLDQLRYFLFDLIEKHDCRPEDIPLRIELLIALTDSGKTLLYYENNMADFMSNFCSKLIERKAHPELRTKKLLLETEVKVITFMTNLVRYNASIMSPALSTMIEYACQQAHGSCHMEKMLVIYDFLNVVLSYSHLPSDSLNDFVIVICIGVNKPEMYSKCNQVMRNLIRTYLGSATLYTLQHIIEDETKLSDISLIRGAIYFLVQSLWGNLANEKLPLSPNTLLPAFKNLILNKSVTCPFYSLEIANGIHKFLWNVCNADDFEKQCGITTRNDILQDRETKQIIFEYTWELVLDICHTLVFDELSKEIQSMELTARIQTLIEDLKALLQKVLSPELLSSNCSENSVNESISLSLLASNGKLLSRIFSILELGIQYLRDESIFLLIINRFKYIETNYQNWISDVKHLIEIFYYNGSNLKTSVRLKFLLELKKFLELNYHFINIDIFWEKVASLYFLQQNDLHNQEIAIDFLVFVAVRSNSLKTLTEIVEIFENIANFQFRTMFQRQHSLDSASGQARVSPHIPVMHQISAPLKQSDQLINQCDLAKTINCLITLFVEKMDHPACHKSAINTFCFLVKFYPQCCPKVPFTTEICSNSNQMMQPHLLKNVSANFNIIKKMFFRLILSLRSNSLGQLGLLLNSQNQDFYHPSKQIFFTFNNETVKFSPFITVSKIRHMSPPESPLQATSSNENASPQQHLQRQLSNDFINFQTSLHEALAYIIDCIRNEVDWSILELVFENLAQMLKNKGFISTLVTSTTSNHSTLSSAPVAFKSEQPFSDLLVKVLYEFIETIPNRLSVLVFCDTKLTRADILSFLYKSISELAGYSLHSSIQTILLKCLKNGLVQFSSKIACLRQCIITLTICSMEMQTTMNKILKDIIITLSQISTSKMLAVPKLEFLSNIILFPDLYYTFTVKQYLSIFSIAQQYVNPYKYGEYTVVLALRVVSMWFLKCPTPFRLQLMKFLTKGLNTNILKEVEPTTPQLPQRVLLANEHRSNSSNFDSHSQSLSSSSSSAFNVCASKMTAEGLILDPNDKENSKMELVEVCMDMFSTNAYNTCSPLPLKPSMIDRLLNRKKSQMWLLGHKIIQITTTGCSSRAFRNGLCNKCFNICHLNENSNSGSETSSCSQSNIFERATFNNQMSYDTGIATHTQTQNGSTRRRHRSEINSTASSGHNSHFTNDDHLSKFNAVPPVSYSDPDLNNGSGDNRYCRCWCQSWAEILIRRSTGNTRWIMRVENNLGDFPYWCYAKEEDDSLANIFSHSDPEITLALKLQKAAEIDPDEKIDLEMGADSDTKNVNYDSNALSMRRNGQSITSSVSCFEMAKKGNATNSVTRASSFGSRRHESQAQVQQAQEQARSNVIRRLEKNYSFEEDEPPQLTDERGVPRHNHRDQSRDSGCGGQTTPIPHKTSVEAAPKIDQNNFSSTNNYRERSTTISVMTPVQKSASSTGVSGTSQPSFYDSSKSTSTLNLSANRPSISPGALSPYSVFLQLYYNSSFKELNELSFLDKPILLDQNEMLIRSISCLDRITPYETHKIGVLYIGPGQVNSKSEILSNKMGSFRYTQFLQKLGHIIKLEDVDSNVCYTGGLDSKKDGPFAVSWGDHLVQAIFHVATFMPTLASDINCNNKMAHIGNDFICIVYNNSREKFDISTIKGDGQFLQAMVVITPLEQESNLVHICAKREFLEFIGHTEGQIVSDNALPVYARQLALHANLAAMVSDPNKSLKSYNISNWINRLRTIKRIRSRALEKLPLFNNEMIYQLRSAANPTPNLAQMHNRSRYGNGLNLSSRDELDSAISPSMASPNLLGSAGLSSTFDYDSVTRLAFPDFAEFTKDIG